MAWKPGLLVLALLSVLAQSSKIKSAKDWKNLDFDQLERDLEEGDDPELLKSEDAIDIELMNRRKEMPLEPPPGAKLTDETEHFRHSQASAGPAILMTTLEPRQANKKKWNKKTLEDLATKWREMLFMAGIEVMCYDMDAAATVAGGSAGGEKQMVVTLQHGWRGYEVRDFLLQQPEVAAVEWDNVKTVPDRYQTKIEVDPVRPAKKAKKSDKKKRKGKQAGAEGKGRAADSDPGEL